MTTLRTLDQVIAVVEDHAARGVPVFVRWSSGPARDRRMGGVSRNHVTGRVECGLSVNGLLSDVLPNDRGHIAARLIEYRAFSAGSAWLLTGTVAGRGSDNEPCLGDDWREIAAVGKAAIAEAERTPRVSGCQHPADQLSRYTGGVVFCGACGLKVA